MNLQEKLISLEKYKIGFNVYDGQFIINITYPQKWKVTNPLNNEIECYSDSNIKGTYYYMSSINTNIEKIYDEIDIIINYNTELEKKAILFKEKVKELEELFIVNQLDALKTLEFKIKINKKKKKNKGALIEDNLSETSANYDVSSEEKVNTEENKINVIINENDSTN